MPPVIFEHPSSLDHDTGGHPEQAARITAITRALDSHEWLGLARRRSTPASRALLEAIHPASHIDGLEALCARGGGHVDLDTVVSERSCVAARHAAGGAAALAGALLAGEIRVGGQPAPAAGPPRHASAGDGVLPVQQRGRGRPACPRRGGHLARADPRLGRAPRQRHQRHLPRHRSGAVLLDSPVAPVSRHRAGARRWLGRRDGLHGQPAGGAGLGRRGVRLAGRARSGCTGPQLSAPAHPRLRRL